MASLWKKIKAAVTVGNNDSWSKPDAVNTPKPQPQQPRVNVNQLTQAMNNFNRPAAQPVRTSPKMPSYGSNPIKQVINRTRDVFDANTPQDYAKRAAVTPAPLKLNLSYQQQQQAKGTGSSSIANNPMQRVVVGSRGAYRQTIGNTTNTLGKGFGVISPSAKEANRRQLYEVDHATQQMHDLANLYRNTNDQATKDRALKAYQSINQNQLENNASLQGRVGEQIANADPRKMGAATIDAGLTVASLGAAGATKAGLKTAVSSVAKTTPVKTALSQGAAGAKYLGGQTAIQAGMGASQGAVSPYITNDPRNVTGKDVRSAALQGAAMNAALPLVGIAGGYAVPSLAKGTAKVAPNVTASLASTITDNAPKLANTLSNATQATTNLVKQAHNDARLAKHLKSIADTPYIKRALEASTNATQGKIPMFNMGDRQILDEVASALGLQGENAYKDVHRILRRASMNKQGGYVKNPLGGAPIEKTRPYDNIQKQIEDAHNSGNEAKVQELLQQIPEKDRAGINPTPTLKPVVDPVTHKITMQPGAQAQKVAPVTKKVKTVYDSDKQLQANVKAQKDIVDAATAEIVQAQKDAYSTYNELSKSIKKTGINQNSLEAQAGYDIPSYFKNKNGVALDEIAAQHGLTPQQLVDALENKPKLEKITDIYARVEKDLASGKHHYSNEYLAAQDFIERRKAELDQLPINSRIIDTPPPKMSEAEWNSLAERAPEQATTKKQAVGIELAGVREELKALEGTKSQINERQRLNVIQGSQNIADAMRKGNTAMLERINELKTKERSLAKQYAQESGADFNKPLKNMSSAEVAQEFAPKSLKDKPAKQKFMDATGEYVGTLKASELDAQLKSRKFAEANPLNDEQKLEFLRAADDPTYKTNDAAVQKAVDEAHNIYDLGYKDFTDKGIKMGYQASYHPRIYKHPVTGEPITAPEYNLYTRSARQAGRTSDTVDIDNLITKDPAEAMKMYFASINKAAAGQKYLSTLENEGLVMKSSDPVRGMRPIIGEGMQSPDGMFFYAKKDVADKLNNMFGSKEASNAIEWIAEKGAGVNSAFQSFVLSGGVPNTPINAFGFMQVMKEAMAYHPIKAGKAFYTGLNKDFANKLFTQKAETIKRMAENGVDVRVDLDAIAKSGMQRVKETEGRGQKINKAWDEFTNDATFKRFMPALEVMHFENIEKGLIKRGIAPKEAAAKAAEATKNFYGKTSMANEATRSKLTQDTIGATLFAPRFRESMLNFWGKNAKALDPRGGFKNARSVEYRDNVKFLVSAAAVYAAMDGVNYALNGTHMYQNPDGKKDKLLIPGGNATEGKTIGIPFLPSIATVPRNAGMGLYNLATGNLEEAGKNAKSFLSMPLRTAGDILTNENYFGAPVVDKNASAPERVAQTASYVAQSNMQPWIREGLNVAGQGLPEGMKKSLGVKDKSPIESISNALELPARFYDPKYFKGGSEKINPKAATEDSQDELKAGKELALKKFKLSGKSEKDIQALADSGNQDAKDAIANLDAMSKAYSTSKSGVPTNIDKLKPELAPLVKGYYDKINNFTEDGKKNWLKQSANDNNKKLVALASQMRPSGMPDLPNTNEVAGLYADYKSRQEKGKWTATQENSEKLKLLKSAYSSALDDTEKFVMNASDSDIYDMISNGEINKEMMDKLVSLDDQLIKLKGSAKFSNKLRKLLGYANQPKSKSSYATAGKSGKKAAKVSIRPRISRSTIRLSTSPKIKAGKIAVAKAKIPSSRKPARVKVKSL